MNRKDIEARLDRSLERQIRAPRLDAAFDAAVWQRIAAEAPRTHAAAEPEAAPPRGARWLFLSNLVGGLIAVALLASFGLKALGGAAPQIGVPVELPVTLPTISDATLSQLISGAGYVIMFLALAFAASLTSFGRRLRDTLSF